MIHDVGEEPALPACKEFLCLTGFVFVLLARWGLIEEDSVKGKTMAQLNRLAVEAALTVARELCRSEDLNRIRTSMQEVASGVPHTERKGTLKNHDQTVYLGQRIRALHDELTRAIAVRKASVRRQVEELLRVTPSDARL
jgi:hypothetical protein